ncbi:hypothetical protein CXR25_13875 [Brevibacterium aurantiacum]|uniref:hypothetical protein n=1 Tax=Brevibacterium aurantiacum TaxID=273384 RepID=UPI000F65378C|nr:hypothetical protein [Brevibacterium aurantiacum]AZL13784.1 hypothetical protein CXR25_13875 [Brevibacterium aurantiacum]
MADIITLNDWTLDQLRVLGATVYDGMVPESVETMTGGYILPYLAVWAQPLREHAEQALAYCDPETAGGVNVTAAGHSAGTVRAWSQAVVQALNRVPVPGGGQYVHAEPHVPIQYDTAVTPARYYQPLSFTFAQP